MQRDAWIPMVAVSVATIACLWCWWVMRETAPYTTPTLIAAEMDRCVIDLLTEPSAVHAQRVVKRPNRADQRTDCDFPGTPRRFIAIELHGTVAQAGWCDTATGPIIDPVIVDEHSRS